MKGQPTRHEISATTRHWELARRYNFSPARTPKMLIWSFLPAQSKGAVLLFSPTSDTCLALKHSYHNPDKRDVDCGATSSILSFQATKHYEHFMGHSCASMDTIEVRHPLETPVISW